MVNKYVLLWVRCLIVAAVILTSFQMDQVKAATLGQTVTNVAAISYDAEGGQQVTVLTNQASFLIEAKRTVSTINFFRKSPKSPVAIKVRLNGADYAPSGDIAGTYIPMPEPSTPLQIRSYKTNHTVSLIPARTYTAGEIMYVRVTDLGQNGDKNRVETVVISVSTAHGDQIYLRLYESGPDTGEFWAWLPSTRDLTPTFDPVLTTPQGTQLNAKYIDAFDAQEISVDTALVDPYGRIFNSITGEYVDNARITLIDATTNQPANVYGVDGVSTYPNSVLSGQVIYDSGGSMYNIRPGEYRFPLVQLGNYYVRVEPPEGYRFASSLSRSDFDNLGNEPFVIDSEASYGRTFNLNGSGPLNFDIPLDAETDLVIAKKTEVKTAAVGDFIPYTVTIENRGQTSAAFKMTDTIPRGFKYVSGSAKLDRITTPDPQISPNGKDLIFKPGVLEIGSIFTLSYVLEVGTDAGKTDAINTIVAVDGNGDRISNIARASVTMREDLLRSTSTLVGRVSENACDGDATWARSIKNGNGVEGVRLYMETGAYAITDQDGLYSFPGITSGTHVVQVDEETLPDGYEIMACEEGSRFAGSAYSQFIEIQGGGLWRANFYLKHNGKSVNKTEGLIFNDRTEYKAFDAKWLGQQTAKAEWVYPRPNRTPSTPSVNIGIKHAPGQTVTMMLNGHKIPVVNFESRDSNQTRTVMMSRWRGVDILEGENHFEAIVQDQKSKGVTKLVQNIYFIKTIARATALPDQSVLVADGRTTPVLAVRLEDEAGRPVHAGRITKIDIPSPYLLHNQSRLEGKEELVSPNTARADIVVGADGIAHIKLEPTLQTGKVTIVVTLDNGRKVELFMYLEPEKRDWIIVGLAEGSAAYNSLKNKSVALASGAADGLVTDGRIAFFAKGLVKGGWMLTLAVDTDKRRGTHDGDFNTEIDPNAYYTLYGDKSYSAFEAASRYPVYVKLEKKSFYAMFGDFETNITEGKLTRYNRHLSGIKSEYLGKNFQAIAYGAETNQGFTKDELAANGTSGPYQLSNIFILGNSEVITIETRDRVRADVILESRRLIRHLDYTIDNSSGEIIFRAPIDVSDSGFNPNVIVVDYETSQDSERNLSYGGRVQKQIMGGRVQIGSTFVHEGGNGNHKGGKSDMIGAEIIAKLTEDTEFRAEFATSRNKQDASTDYDTANAYLAEIIHTSDKLTAGVYVRSEEAGFGLSQRSTTTSDIRRYGANLDYELQKLEDEKTGRRGSRKIVASLYREDNLGTGATRTLSEATINQESETLSASFGLRTVKDTELSKTVHESVLALASIRYTLPQHGASFQISQEQPLGSKNNVGDFPQRTRISVEKSIAEKASIRISHDILNNTNGKSENTSAGISYAPWAGTEVSVGSDMITSESGRRIGATIGLDQQFQFSPKWSSSFGLTNRRIFNGTGVVDQIAPDIATSSLETNEAYMAGYVGFGYRTKETSVSTRLELRDSSQSQAVTANLAAAREISETLSFAGAVRAYFRDQNINGDATISGKSTRIDGRFGTAWRPKNNDGLVFLNRFDVNLNNSATGNNVTKLINNFTANAMLTERLQLAGHYGVKYVKNKYEGTTYSGFTHLVGAETRFDITERIDVGLHGSVIYGQGSDSFSYAYGPSIGISPVKNVWMSVGYNVNGYKDQDFSAAEYSQKGMYLKFRFKFDQNSARGLLDMISPKS